ncbi:MAG TPA: hypothetical protein VEG39_17615 [Clostridia bacterium]|nr:hypothetical protein [Clostridia bacterium]
MGKKKLVLIFGILGILIVLISFKSMVKPQGVQSEANAGSDLKSKYTRLVNSGNTAMIVFSYDSDC